jgi:predicted TIM-barrel fold metal-dependent hydrolase
LGDTFYDPIYQATQDVGLPIVYHSSGPGIDDFVIRGFQRFIETHTLGFVFFNMAHIVSMIVQGVPERFPNIKFGFQEAGIFYIPMLMYRLDAEFRKRRAEAPLLKRLPSEYMLEFFYGTQPIEEPPRIEYLHEVFKMIDGVNTLTFATDYPHWDFDMPSVISDLPFLSEEESKQILGGNAMRFFRFGAHA